MLRSRILGRSSVVGMAVTAALTAAVTAVLPLASASAQAVAPAGQVGPSVASPPAGSDRPLVVVLQSGLGASGGDALRAELARRFELDVTTVRDGNLASTPPRAMLTLAIDERGELNAIYWDDAGGFEVFSAPAPKEPGALNTAALTLATALVQRHIETLRHGSNAMANRELSPKDLELMQRAALYSMLVRRGSIGRLAVQLRPEDF